MGKRSLNLEYYSAIRKNKLSSHISRTQKANRLHPMIPTIQPSGKDKTIKTVKLSAASRGLGKEAGEGRRDEQVERRGVEGTKSIPYATVM